jgi:hypothetical protein
MNPKQIIDLAKKACHPHEKSIFASPWGEEWVLRFAESVAAAERERLSYDGIHTCHAECQRPACVAVREAVQREREACAKVCDDWPVGRDDVYSIGQAIRARGEK